jgi:hypothetical protein
MRHSISLCVAFSFPAALANLPAQELIAVNFAGQAFAVDSTTGQTRTIGATGVTSCNAMARKNNVLYATAQTGGPTGARQLVTIDPITAQASVLFPNLGVDLRGLAPKDGSNELYGIADGQPDRLVTIDLTTGQVTTIGNTGFTGIQALDSEMSLLFLFGWDVNAGLVRIDPATGVTVDVNPSLGTQGAAIQFLTRVVDDGGTPRLIGGNSALFSINVTTGAVTPIGTAGTLSDVRGAELHRGVATQFGLGCASVGAANASLGAKGDLLAGTTVAMNSPSHAPNSLGLLIVGFSNATYLGAPLPIDLDPLFGTSGCDLHVSADALLPVQANGAGAFAFGFPMPAVLGGQLFFQLAALEAVPGGWSVTNGLSVQMPF